jgi:hypothetical protein
MLTLVGTPESDINPPLPQGGPDLFSAFNSLPDFEAVTKKVESDSV